MGPATDAGFVQAVKEGRIELVPGVTALDRHDVVLGDGSRVQPDTVICATGYRRGLDELVGHLGVLDERGLPRRWPEVEVAPEAPDLFFVGYRSTVSGQLRQMRFEARRVARTVKRRAAGDGTPRRRLAWSAKGSTESAADPLAPPRP